MNIRIDTDKIYKEFDDHFINSNTERILFSSAFGTGKSTFLNEYFKTKEYCNVFKIYPVSYSVANNEDIFELIKYDVLFQLFERSEEGEFDLINEDYSQILAFQFKFLTEIKFSPILFKLLEFADKTGKYSVIEKIVKETKNQYESFKTKHINEEENIFNFLFKQYSKEGSPRENDLISKLIRELLGRLIEASENEQNEKKENVLIIDDLDRLDPEHIFRLFNVFSVNFGSNEIENKFGFDKIIFVCDYENIRKIYEHRYGKGVDFEGYIDKFYSISPFKFNTNKLLSNYVKDLLQGFNLPTAYIDFGDPRAFDYSPNYIALKALLRNFIKTHKLNLRKLLTSNSFTINYQPFSFVPRERESTSTLPIITLFQILEGLFDTPLLVEETFMEMSKTFDKNAFAIDNALAMHHNHDAYNILVSMALPFIINYKNLLSSIEDMNANEIRNLSLEVYGFNVSAEFTVNVNFGRDTTRHYAFKKFSNKRGEEEDINIYEILLIAFKKCKSLNLY